MTDEKKGFKRTEVGLIPEDWKLKSLDEIGTFSKGKGIKKSEVKNEGIPCVRYGELYTKHHEQIHTFYSFIDESVAKQSRILSDGDILFAGSGETKKEIGKCVAFNLDIEAYAGGDIVILSPADYNSKFLGYALNSEIASEQKYQRAQGDAVVHIYSSSLNSIKIPLPPTLAEQQAIATALSDVDELIRSLDSLIKKKEAIKKGTMQQLLSGKKRLPGFDGEWEVKKAEDIGSFRGGNGFPLKYQGESKGKYPFFKVSDMNILSNDIYMVKANNYIDITDRKSIGATVFPSGSIVFAKVGAAIFLERKKILSQPSCIDNNMAAFTIDKTIADYNFIRYLLLNLNLGDYSSTTALPSLNNRTLSKIELLIPKLPEQKAIAQILSDMDEDLQALRRKREKMVRVKEGMMQQLLTGRMRIRINRMDGL